MKTKTLGTVLPTSKSLAINDRYAGEQKRKQNAVAQAHFVLRTLAATKVGDETRYYLDADHYAIVGYNDLRVKWFERRKGEFYSITEKEIKNLIVK